MRAVGIVVAALAVAGCYEMNPASVRVRTPNTELDCLATADRVFDREGYGAPGNVSGPGRFYSPRVSPQRWMGLHWGITVKVDSDRPDQWKQCMFELQAVSIDETCGLVCPLTPQPGREFDDAVRKMATLLHDAFAGPAVRSAAAGPP
jgi:hypothetical protein